MRVKDHLVHSNGGYVPRGQRALFHQSCWVLDTCEVGVMEILCKKFAYEDKEDRREAGLLFDIAAGISIDDLSTLIKPMICNPC